MFAAQISAENKMRLLHTNIDSISICLSARFDLNYKINFQLLWEKFVTYKIDLIFFFYFHLLFERMTDQPYSQR